ncbi:2OG-Fe(II) oxygenase family protein [Rhodanobacter sp. DHG33]|uniref:2OG-Fe(II) oxygenase family protein n=1 Tax=Rhodanobacter sp. DHG33 TaxID=2775921 RepID=UPI001785EE3C|nr:2OG-Fe(II) oxygenase family protein [Rhodanobacter sp. DHG33]MBD8897934.1 tetratricopeptide repeat protein [Rhodanobacter sp. DHG33]
MAITPPTLLESMRQVGALLQSGDLRGAHERLQAIVATQPDCVEALRLLGALRLGLGDADGAEALLRRALALDPNWAPTLATLGELLLNGGREEEAEPLLRRAAAKLPQAALLLARHCNDRQRPAEALAIVEPLCATGRAPIELVAQHVNALAALGRRDDAVAFYQRLADSAPEESVATHALAIALGAAARHRDAERIAGLALARGHRAAGVHFTHARSLVALGEFARAEAALRDGLLQEPRNVEAHDHLARLVWMRTGDLAQSTALLDSALQRFAGDEALLAAKAAVLQGAGDARGALACLAGAAERPQAPPALLVRTGLAALDVDPAAARALAERALARSPTAAARSLLAAALLGTGEPERALAQCEALLDATPDDQYLIALQTTAWRLLGDARHDAYCDYAQLVKPYRLQTPDGWPDLDAYLADLKRSLERLHDPQGHPLLFQSLRHGTETTEDLARHNDPVIQALFKAFDAPIRDYLAHIGHGTDPLRRRNRGTYRYNGSWSVRLRRAGFHTSHVHPRGWISSACYIDLPDGMAEADTPDGCLAFGEPGIVTMPPLHTQHVVRPAPGMLVLFPSYVWHGTVPFHSERARLTVAFDAVPGISA